jgi:hypothetical protein
MKMFIGAFQYVKSKDHYCSIVINNTKYLTILKLVHDNV